MGRVDVGFVAGFGATACVVVDGVIVGGVIVDGTVVAGGFAATCVVAVVVGGAVVPGAADSAPVGDVAGAGALKLWSDSVTPGTRVGGLSAAVGTVAARLIDTATNAQPATAAADASDARTRPTAM